MYSIFILCVCARARVYTHTRI